MSHVWIGPPCVLHLRLTHLLIQPAMECLLTTAEASAFSSILSIVYIRLRSALCIVVSQVQPS